MERNISTSAPAKTQFNVVLKQANRFTYLMEKHCDYFLLTATVQKMWETNDLETSGRLYQCLYKIRESHFFRGLIFDKGKVVMEKMKELAEDAFHDAWISFNHNGKLGKVQIIANSITQYFRSIVKNKFISRFRKELKRNEGEKGFSRLSPENNPLTNEDCRMLGFDSPVIQDMLKQSTNTCREMLTMRFREGLTDDVIAQSRNIRLENVTKMISACKQTFLLNFRDRKKGPDS